MASRTGVQALLPSCHSPSLAGPASPSLSWDPLDFFPESQKPDLQALPENCPSEAHPSGSPTVIGKNLPSLWSQEAFLAPYQLWFRVSLCSSEPQLPHL